MTPTSRPTPARLAMVCSTCSAVDGILDYACRLGEAMAELHGLPVDLVLRRGRDWSVKPLGRRPAREDYAPDLDVALDESDALMLHYNPFSWGRRGFAPWLVPAIARVRRRRPGVAVAVMVHERYVDMHDARSIVMGGWQRLQFLALLRTATTAFASTDRWAHAIRRQTRAPVTQLPIGSNLPDARGARGDARKRLELDETALAVAVFGTNHPTRLTGHIESAVKAIASGIGSMTVLNLGADPPRLSGLSDPRVRVIAPGRLEASDVAELLAAADLYLAPFADGVSARRTTLMAALQHALPVVGTDGELTDPALRSARDALLLTPTSDADAFAAAACTLVADPNRRARQGAAARRLYETRYDFPIACKVALAGLTGHDGHRIHRSGRTASSSNR